MTHEKNQPGSRSSAESGPVAGPSLARRVSGWTSNLLATGIVLAAAVGVGRQLTVWWRADSDANAVAPVSVGPGAMGEQGEQPFELTLGGGYSLRRIEFPGSVDAALERLRGECRTIAESGRLPQQPAGEPEQRFLARTGDRAPLEERAGKWQIHQFDGKLPLMVVVVDAGPSARGASRLHKPRVVAWGLAMPTDEEACTLLVYEAGAAAGGHSSPEEMALPSGFRRTLTLRGQGETSIGLASDFSPRRSTGELDRFLASRGWTSRGWRQAGGAWHNRYQDAGGKAIDLQLADDGRGGAVGLLIMAQ